MSRGRNGAAGGAKGARRASVAAPAAVLGGKGRWSARRKMTVVLELLRGAELEATSRKYGVTAATLTHWREAFIEGGEAGLKIRATDVVDEERKTLDDGQVTVFAAVDHCTAECVGIHAVKRATRFEALEPLRQGVRQHFGGFRGGAAEGLRLRHDHGSQFMSDDFQNELAFLGIESSPAFVREPEGNGCIERFFRTLKEQLLWVRPFQSIPELVRALEEFRALYNQHWLIEPLGFQPPVRARQRLALQPAA